MGTADGGSTESFWQPHPGSGLVIAELADPLPG